MEPFKYFSLQSCARLSFVCRGCWGDLKEKGISLRGSGVLPLPGSCREHISRTWLLLQAAPSSSKGQKLPCAPCKSQPNTTKRALPYDGLPCYLLEPLCSQHLPLVLLWDPYLSLQQLSSCYCCKSY